MKMNKLLYTLLLLLFGCANDMSLAQSPSSQKNSNHGGEQILKTGRYMALQSKEIVRGSCWDYINEVYTRSGYPQNKRETVYKTHEKKGPYAQANQIKPGDWLYHINHSYHDVPHSGIFIRWINRSQMIGETLSYQGERKRKPGRYRNYDLSHVYTIIRPQ